MWLVDRSRYLVGLQQCQMKRYYTYHAANGYGFVRRGSSLPLATGIYVHQALAGVLEGAMKAKGIPGKDLIRKEIATQVKAYKSQIKARGFLNIEDDAEVEHTVQEQCGLLAGLVWGWCKAILPTLLQEYEILDVEREEEPLDLGQGVFLMVRQDFVARRRFDGQAGIHDFKTSSYEPRVEEYKHSPQMALSTKAVEARLGEPVTHYVIHGLVKGARKADYNSATQDYDGPKRQQSFLCYPYVREANPPLQEPDYQPKWKYKGSDGRNHILGTAYQKTPIWRSELTPEKWVEMLPTSLLWEIFPMLGPYQRQTWMLDGLQKEMVAEEKRWINKLHRVFDSGDSPEVLATEIPRSWGCFKYGSDHACEFLKLCTGEELDPLGSGKFVLRRPHHDPEIEQMQNRGLEVPPPEVGDGDEA